MKSFLRRLALLGALFLIGTAVSPAHAGVVQSGAAFTGIIDVRTTDTAGIVFLGGTGFEEFEASGWTTSGTADLSNDGMFFDSSTSASGEGTAVNGGSGDSVFSDSFASSENTLSSAYTFVDTELELVGVGTVEIDLGYDLFVDGFGNDASAFGNASIFVSTTFTSLVEETIELLELTGSGDSDGMIDFITLVIDVDDLGLGPYVDTLTVGTEANALATVPLPAAAYLLGSAVLGFGVFFRRKTA